MTKYKVTYASWFQSTVVLEVPDGLGEMMAETLAFQLLKTRERPGSKIDTLGIEADSEARSDTYSCTFCLGVFFKEMWGPGRVTCPGCKKLAPSANEKGTEP